MGKPRSSWASATLYGTQGERASGKSRGRGYSDPRAQSSGYGHSHDARQEDGGRYGFASGNGAYSQPGPRAEDDNPFDENSPSYKSSLAAADAEYAAAFGSGHERGDDAGARRAGMGGAGASRHHSRAGDWTDDDDERNHGIHSGKSAAGRPSRPPGGTRSKSDPWGAGGWSQATSPTSSRGTRDSAQLDAEDPFR